MSEQSEKSPKNRGPVETLRDAGLKVSIFRNENERGVHYSMKAGRIYTDAKSGEVRESSSFQGTEALRMSALLVRAYERVLALRGQDRHAQMNAARREPERER